MVIGRFLFGSKGATDNDHKQGTDQDINGHDIEYGHGTAIHVEAFDRYVGEISRSNSRVAEHFETDTKSIKSIVPTFGDGSSSYDPNSVSRKHSNVSHLSAISTASTRKKIYSYENGIMLTS